MLKVLNPKTFLSVLVILLAVVMFAEVSSAQDKPEFTNLKVLDSTITKPELIATMKMMSQSLGARCDYCHAENAQGEHDFASDEKEQKKVARTMMVLTNDINASLLSKLTSLGEKNVQTVTCYTCHHNDTKPRVLSEELIHVMNNAGLDSAIVRYHALKDKYYGASVYDFSENSLNSLALALAEKKQVDDALKILELNQSEFPESTDIKEMFVLVYMRADQKEKAIEVCRKLLVDDPNNRWVKRTLKQLTEEK